MPSIDAGRVKVSINSLPFGGGITVRFAVGNAPPRECVDPSAVAIKGKIVTVDWPRVFRMLGIKPGRPDTISRREWWHLPREVRRRYGRSR